MQKRQFLRATAVPFAALAGLPVLALDNTFKIGLI